ncbi:MAG: hypothetical protein KJI71_01040 [Patescibacteria group bacterium]|nr:hypothetical protein [Patescibacteria group bacterium]
MSQKAWIVDVNMGYGHQRAAYPLKNLAPGGKVISANDYGGIPERDRRVWENSRKFYEFVSKFKRLPLIGEPSFFIFDQFQKILSFYPRRDLSKPNLYLKRIYYLFKKGWGRHLIEKLKENPLPLISTFFVPAFMAEAFGYPGEIFCVITDTDVARHWAPLNPSLSKIKYLAPNNRVVERLKLYGVRPENIFLTGYPLPLENLGTENLEVLKQDLNHRLFNLDPKKKYFQRYQSLIEKYLGNLTKEPDHPLTITFAVGGAGAQKEIGVRILKSLKKRIDNKEVKIILVAGIREPVKEYFLKNIENLNLKDNIEIVFNSKIEDYFKSFNSALRKTDILWTKPSELSFYSALGLPIIIAPTIGSQEEFNQKWLLKLGSGILQHNPDHTNQWLFDLLGEGSFAEAAMQGFVEAEKRGTFNIQKIISEIK